MKNVVKVCSIVWALLGSQLLAAYSLESSGLDSGGKSATASQVVMAFQSVGSPVVGVVDSSQQQVIQGRHFSSRVKQIDGFQSPYEAGDVTLNASVVGTIISKVEFYAIKDNDQSVTFSVMNDTSTSNGWQVVWDSLPDVANEESVTFFARAHDGLSWGEMTEVSSAIVVDNAAPIIDSLSVSEPIFSPNNATSVGVKDSTSFAFNLSDPNFKEWVLKIVDNGPEPSIEKQWGNTVSQNNVVAWQGKDSQDQWSEDGTYQYELTAIDLAGNKQTQSGQIDIDNTSPTISSVVLTAQGGDLNSAQGSLDAQWQSEDAQDSDLDFVIQLGGSSNPIVDPSADVSWMNSDPVVQQSKTYQQLGVADNHHFYLHIEANDDAGNKTVTVSNTVYTPDRTPPVISEALTLITTTEDTQIVFDPQPFQSDNLSADNDLTWDIQMITAAQDPFRSAEEVFQFVQTTDGNTKFSLSPLPDANTALPIAGNRYGKEQAWATVTLTDKEGNSVNKDIQLFITPVNDPPIFLADLGLSTPLGAPEVALRDGNGQIVYNVKTNEDTLSDPMDLNLYIDDVDNLKEDLVWTVSSNYYFQESPEGFNGVQFSNNQDLTVQIKNEQGQRQWVIKPEAERWGDFSIDLKVSDTLLSNTKNAIVRVWPVNDAPIISGAIPQEITFQEDQVMQVLLTQYESDHLYEDRPPTYNNLLNWHVVSFDSNFISAIDQTGDTLTLSPVENKYGTTNIVVGLTDTDILPTAIYPENEGYGGYIPNPLTTTASISVVWHPVNDPPVIGGIISGLNTIPDQEKNEDDDAWSIDLSHYQSDADANASDLVWTIDFPEETFATFNYDAQTKLMTISPKENAWGEAMVTATLTDLDQSVVFVPYTPQPQSVTTSFRVIVNPQNDTPNITSVALQGSHSNRTDMVMTDDTITATAAGFNDPLDEYLDSYPTTNVQRYNYKWFVDGSLAKQTLHSLTQTDTFVVTDSYEGKSISIEAWPDDGYIAGPVVINSIAVNNRPDKVDMSQMTPTQDTSLSTGNVSVSWPGVSDSDGTPASQIGYRAKVWKVDKGAEPPEEMTLDDATAFYDTQWQLNKTAVTPVDLNALYEHGSYYWKIWTANQFSPIAWDTQTPTEIGFFHVDLVNPEIPEYGELLQVSDLENQASIEESGNTRVLYGQKPESADDSFEYQIILYWENRILNEQGEWVITTGNQVIVDYTSDQDWTYVITFPDGETTYTLYIKDKAGNIQGNELGQELYQFSIVEDTTPPAPIKVKTPTSNTPIQVTAVAAVTSQNFYFIQGEKEKGAGVFYEGLNYTTNQVNRSQIVGFTPAEFYQLLIYPDKPKGVLTTQDRAGNIQSVSTNVDITFLVGAPTITVTSISEDTVSHEMASIIAWQADRDIQSYTWSSGSEVIASGDQVLKNEIVQTSVSGNHNLLTHGANELTLTVIDSAGNSGTKTQSLTVLKEPPSTQILTSGSVLSKIGATWRVALIGSQVPYSQVFINDAPVSSNTKTTWYYFDQDFNPLNESLIMRVVDSVGNEASLTLWNHTQGQFTGLLETETDIVLPPSFVTTQRLKVQESTLKDIRVYPNPWIPEDGQYDTGSLASGLVFDQLHQNSRIRLYTVSGQEIQDITLSNTTWRWNGKNKQGHDVASGVYLYLITYDGGKKKGKITVIR